MAADSKFKHPYANQMLSFFRLVGGAGQVKLTKDGRVLLYEMVSHTLTMLIVLMPLANPTPHCSHDWACCHRLG